MSLIRQSYSAGRSSTNTHPSPSLSPPAIAQTPPAEEHRRPAPGKAALAKSIVEPQQLAPPPRPRAEVIQPKEPGMRPLPSSFAVIAAAPPALGDRPFDPELYAAARAQGEAALRAFALQLDDRGVAALGENLGQNPANLELQAALLPAIARASELRALGDRTPGLEQLEPANIQTLADHLSRAARSDAGDREWLFRLAAAKKIDARTIEYAGKNLHPQFLANRSWSPDPAIRDRRASTLAWMLDRMNIPRRDVFFGPPAPDGPVLDAQGRTILTPGRKGKTLSFEDGAPNWPSGLPFTRRDGAPIIVAGSGSHEAWVNFGDYRSQTIPDWARATYQKPNWDIIPDAPAPLGTLSLPDISEDELAAELDQLSYGEIAELRDSDLILAYLRLTSGGRWYEPWANLDADSRLAKTAIAARMYELKNDNIYPRALVDILGATEPREASEIMSGAPALPELDWSKLLPALPDNYEGAAAAKRLANAVRKPFSELPWHRDGVLGKITLEDAVTTEKGYLHWAFPDPEGYVAVMERVRDRYGPTIGAKLEAREAKLATRYESWGRGPRWVGHSLEVADPRSAAGHESNIIIVGEPGLGKTSLRNDLLESMVADGSAPRGYAVLTWAQLGPALLSDGPSQVTLNISTLQDDGSFKSEMVELKFSELLHRLQGYALGVEEIGEAAPMVRRREDQDRALQKLRQFMISYMDKVGPMVCDGLDATGIRETGDDGGVKRRTEVITLTRPDRGAVVEAIEKISIRRAQQLAIQSVSLEPHAKEWLVRKFTNDPKDAAGYFGRLEDLIDAAIAGSAQRGYSDNLTIHLRDLLGPVTAPEKIAAFGEQLRAKTPQLFGLEAQIASAEAVLSFIAGRKDAGEDPRFRLIFESPPGTRVEEIAEELCRHATLIGAASGSSLRVDKSIADPYVGVTQRDVDRMLSANRVPVIWDVTDWPVPTEQDDADSRNVLEQARQALRQRLASGTVECNLILLGDRLSISRFLKGFGEPPPFDSPITTSRVKNPGDPKYLQDRGHLSDEALIKYLLHDLEKYGAELRDEGFAQVLASIRCGGYDKKIREFLAEEKKNPRFANRRTIETLVRRLVIAAHQESQATAENIEPGKVMVSHRVVGEIVPQLTTSQPLSIWQRFSSKLGIVGIFARRPLDVAANAIADRQTRMVQQVGLGKLQRLIGAIERARWEGNFTDKTVRGLVREVSGAEELLVTYEKGSLGELSAQNIANALKEIRDEQKELYEELGRTATHQYTKDKKERKADARRTNRQTAALNRNSKITEKAHRANH